MASSSAVAPPQAEPLLRPASSWQAPPAAAAERIAQATDRRRAVVRDLFARAGIAYPPQQLLLRGFKREARLEVWAGAAGAQLSHLTTYEICFASGDLGPKRKEGDGQVPEGFYTIQYFNPASRFHLSLQVSYPNRSDRLLGDPKSPGGEIMIHGNCRSAGCLAMTDERIEELWVMASAVRDAGQRVQVHLFPSRQLSALIASGEYPQHQDFWRNLLAGFLLFERTHRLPVIQITAAGRYRFAEPTR